MQILDNIRVLNSYVCFSNEQLVPLVRRHTLVLLNNFPLLLPEVHVKHAQQSASQGRHQRHSHRKMIRMGMFCFETGI